MLRKSLKYLTIATANLIILTVLLAFWTDNFELIFNEYVRLKEFLKIIGITALSLTGMRILVSYFRKRNIQAVKTRLLSATLLTCLISSYLYVDYSTLVIKNVAINRNFRNQIADKIQPAHKLACGTKADDLTISEYQEIAKMNWFPKLPAQTTHIRYLYGYDGFLPDYIFTLVYDVPKEMQIDTLNYKTEHFSKSRQFVIVGDKKRVTYSEGKN